MKDGQSIFTSLVVVLVRLGLPLNGWRGKQLPETTQDGR
jgi:hypothetical protein